MFSTKLTNINNMAKTINAVASQQRQARVQSQAQRNAVRHAAERTEIKAGATPVQATHASHQAVAQDMAKTSMPARIEAAKTAAPATMLGKAKAFAGRNKAALITGAVGAGLAGAAYGVGRTTAKKKNAEQ